SGPSTFIISRFADIAFWSREIIATRIMRAHHDRWSLRAFHCAMASCVSPGNCRLKYQNRSMISVHMMTPFRKIRNTNGPPPSTKPRTAAIGAMRLPSIALLDHCGEEAFALFVVQGPHLAGDRREQRIAEQERNRDAEAEHRRDHRLRDTGGHQLRIARAGFRDALERDDHPDDRTDQAEQGAGCDREAKAGLEAFELRNLGER